MGYLTIRGPRTTPSAQVPLRPEQLTALRGIAGHLAAAFAVAAERAEVDLVRVSVLSRDHAPGSGQPRVSGLRWLRELVSTVSTGD